MATSKIKSNTWQKLGEYASTASISISGISFTELMVIGKGEGGAVPITIPNSDLSQNAQIFFAGGYALPNANVGFYVTASTSQITTVMYVNGVSKSATICVYYK